MKFPLKWSIAPNLLLDNLMREGGLEPPCLAAPDPKSSTPPEQDPNNGLATRTEPHESAPVRAGHVTKTVTGACRECGAVPPDINWRCRVCGPALIAARVVKGGTDRWCHECNRAISSSWPLRLTYRQGRSVFVAWAHPHVSEDEGQLPCAPDSPLVLAALGRGVDHEKSNASTTDARDAT